MWKFIQEMLNHLGYPQIIFLMTIESSFIPFPSEIVVPPAAYRASQGELNLMLVILASTLGSLLGAYINYFLGYFLGRKVIYSLADTKVAHALFINSETIMKAENYFIRYGKSSTFICRLVPGIRQWVSLPAGIAKMPFFSFTFYTLLGSFLWSAVLGLLGYYLGANQALLHRYYREISIVLLGAFMMFIGYLIWKSKKKK